MNDHDTKHRPLLGCVADDMTGATDLANNLVSAGMRVIQFFKVPSVDQIRQTPADAIVVALKTRSIDPTHAARHSVDAIKALHQAGCQRFFFKYCSTFDSTPKGNIGPVAEAIMDCLGETQTVFCPAFPRAGRTVYQGHLFVGADLLNESGMQNHPINPMNDANLTRVLSPQTTMPVGLIRYGSLTDAESITDALAKKKREGIAHVVMDACDDEHLKTIAESVASMRFITGGSGIASFLPAVYRRQGLLDTAAIRPELPRTNGRCLILSGSCSSATNRQVAAARPSCESWPIDIARIADDFDGELSRVTSWMEHSDESKPLLIFSTSDPRTVRESQLRWGVAETAGFVERFFAGVANESVNRMQFRKLVVAGGETSGAVVKGLGVDAIRIGPEICAGVPWTESVGEPSVALALKSGNFGGDNFFVDALEMLR